MAFCKQCGADLNGANFCASCGTPAEGNVVVLQAAPVMADPRQRTLADMEHMMSYFGAKSAVYDEFDAVAAEVAERTQRSFGGWIAAAVISLLIGLFTQAAFFYIAIVPFVVAFVLLKKKNNEKLAVVTARYNELSNELDQLYADYGYCALGQEYTKPALLKELYDLVRKGRASTPGDAVNIYLADLDKIAQQEKLDEIAKSTKEAAKTAKDARNIAAARFIFKR